jgi:hypothetical protein
MGLWQVDARRSNFLPQKADCVQSDPLRALLHIEKKQVENFIKEHRRAVVEVNLICAKGRPYIFDAVNRCERRQ